MMDGRGPPSTDAFGVGVLEQFKRKLMQQFVGDEFGYLAWIGRHPQGLVVNSDRAPVAGYLKLHRATCTFINSPRRNFTSTGYIKTCFVNPTELAAWAHQVVGGELDPCPFCKPDGNM